MTDTVDRIIGGLCEIALAEIDANNDQACHLQEIAWRTLGWSEKQQQKARLGIRKEPKKQK